MENKIIKEKPKFIGSNSFKFWLEVDKIRKANNIVKKFKKNSIIKNYYELKDLIIKKKMKTELEEAAEQFEYTDGIYGFKEGAKWQMDKQERMYSEEDLKEAYKSCYTPFSFDRIGDLDEDFKKWFEQFKKK